ncbi:hypothetical protein [Methylobacterium isbiliense]|uniref:Uncharacterized protein n=1 Tax=Methylobacterium isbiliense TaxID=315478 RepID=A0ABQ4SIX7_9HYPH|nr:hypothetical protein [Methylobacterium isbiliense]MDN3624116.1 hypothetical protein [Methylobacterium isbiliense]GJE01838.1 hypothetical protein GMJLKIPL_3775 [Methylobacterium isbiliense]
MSDFTDLIARAVSPSMSRAEREAVYGVVRQAMRRLQERDALDPADARAQLQAHFVEETIWEVEGLITRHLARQTIEAAERGQVSAPPP